MANTGYTSPFPTSHDTIGQSTLVTPLFMPSSPPQPQTSPTPLDTQHPSHPESPVSDNFNPHSEDEDDHNPQTELHYSHRTRSPTGSDLDARLAEHTLDFSRFGSDNMPLPDLNEDMEERLSDVGGPEDFTANMEEYFSGGRKSSARNLRTQQEDAHSATAVRQSSVRSQQVATEEYGDSAEYSEFGPPVDMSTPSHVLHRTSALAKDSTQLEDIDEDPADGLPSPESRSSRRMSSTSRGAADEREHNLQQRIAELEEELHNREEQILNDQRRLRDASSATEQIRHLQADLQRKNDHILIIEAKNSDQKVLRDQIQTLKARLDEQAKQVEQPKNNDLDFQSLQQQLSEMQQLLKSQDQHKALDAERLETISHLRRQLDHSQDQLKKRDATLEDTLSRLKEVTNGSETQLREKNSEIDRLKADLDHMTLENERLDTELDHANTDYEALEDRLTSLETKNQPLEERNQSLEADLNRVQSQVEARENALKSMAADLPIGNRSTYSEILDLINDLGPPESDMVAENRPLEDRHPVNSEVQTLRDEIAKFEQELQDASGGQKAAQAEAGRLREQATEMQSLIKTIEAENLRLTKRVEELTTTLNITQHDLTRTQEEHAESLEIITRLKEDLLAQPPSPPPSPPRATNDNGPDTAALEQAHQAQIKSLQTAHSTAISTLRSSHTESMRKIRLRLAAAEKSEADLRVELTTLRASVSNKESYLLKYKAEINRLEEVITMKEEVSAELDKRVAHSMQKREREWQRRIDLLLKERDRMARVLMKIWGEQEMGRGPGPLADGKENRRKDGDHKQTKEQRREDGERKQAGQGQAYRYKYVKKQRSKSRERSA